MLLRKPHYFDRFQCAMGDCTDTCCAAWDIEIDEEHAALYRTLNGELGERIRAALREDADGALSFSVEGGHCPLLTREGLCSIQLELGESFVCDTCRSHPRFWEEYGTFKEGALAASCPAAVRLILAEDASLESAWDDEAEFSCEDVDEKLLRVLLPARERAFELLERRDWTWNERLSVLLRLGTEGQLALCMGGTDALREIVTTEWRDPPPVRRDREKARATRRRCVELLGELEVLDGAWARDIAAHRLREETAPVSEELERRWVHYLLWRWFLRADFDGDLYSKLALPVLSLVMLRELSGGENWMEWARRWAKEIEHCAENRNRLYDALCGDVVLAPERLIAAL